MEDLLLEYKQTKTYTAQIINDLKDRIDQLNIEIEMLKKANAKTKKADAAAIEKVLEKTNELKKYEHQRSIFSSCKSDVDYAIYWMENGHAPGATRGIERRAVYEREKVINPLLIQQYFRASDPVYSWDDRPQREDVISTDDKERIEMALSDLTEREREMYLLYKTKGISQYKIADMFYVTRNTVKTTLARAERKIKKKCKEMSEQGI